MAEDLIIRQGSREEQYKSIIPQINALLEGEDNLIANLANICAALKEQFGWWWVGFYLVQEGELILGPFQGPIACTRIKKGRGVCGSSWEQAETIIVEDVNKFSGHIACSAASKSEIVLPIIRNGNVLGVLDIDSNEYATFSPIDEKYLKMIIDLIKFK